jgi:hypothetical protein
VGRDSVLQLAAGPGLLPALCMVVPKGLFRWVVGLDSRCASHLQWLFPTLMHWCWLRLAALLHFACGRLPLCEWGCTCVLVGQQPVCLAWRCHTHPGGLVGRARRPRLRTNLRWLIGCSSCEFPPEAAACKLCALHGGDDVHTVSHQWWCGDDRIGPSSMPVLFLCRWC